MSAQVKQETKDVGFVGIIQKILLGFGGVALFVGAFVIFNTISITVAQRMRELATLRTIGASRRQVMASVLGEALVVGALAAVAGLFLGFGLAVGLDKLMSAIGIDLPKSATVFATRTVVVSLIVGIVITLLSALRPALRATRVPPIAAVREGADLPPGRLAFLGPPLKAIVAAAGIALLLYGFFVHGSSPWAWARSSCSWAWPSSPRGSCVRSHPSLAGRRRRSAGAPATSRAQTRSATQAAPPRPRPRS